MKYQIWEIIKTKLPKREYYLDCYAESMGHKVLRLPPYHRQYSGIQMVWSESKRIYDQEIIKTNESPNDVIQTWTEALMCKIT